MDEMSSLELRFVLECAGFSQREFAESIPMSRSFVGSMVRGERPVQLRYVDALKRFLGKELYAASLEVARKRISEIEIRHKEHMERLKQRTEGS